MTFKRFLATRQAFFFLFTNQIHGSFFFLIKETIFPFPQKKKEKKRKVHSYETPYSKHLFAFIFILQFMLILLDYCQFSIIIASNF